MDSRSGRHLGDACPGHSPSVARCRAPASRPPPTGPRPVDELPRGFRGKLRVQLTFRSRLPAGRSAPSGPSPSLPLWSPGAPPPGTKQPGGLAQLAGDMVNPCAVAPSSATALGQPAPPPEHGHLLGRARSASAAAPPRPRSSTPTRPLPAAAVPARRAPRRPARRAASHQQRWEHLPCWQGLCQVRCSSSRSNARADSAIDVVVERYDPAVREASTFDLYPTILDVVSEGGENRVTSSGPRYVPTHGP